MNNKGFMLAEVVIVSAILVTTIVGLYSGFSTTYKAYEVRGNYYDAKSIYALKNLEDFLVDELFLNQIATTSSFTYKEINDSAFEDNYYKVFINNFNSTYNMKKIYLLSYTESNINNFSNNSIVDDDFEDYLDFYLEKVKEETNNNTFDASKYSYLLVCITNDNTYASLRIR